MSVYQDYSPALRDHSAPAPGFAASVKTRLRSLLASVVSQPYVLGCDLSHWNSFVDFQSLKAAGYEFCILKATEGVTYTDPTFSQRWQAALDAGLIVGAYHFFRSNLDGGAQADYHLTAIRPLLEAAQGHIIPPANDVETNDATAIAARQARVRAWSSLVSAALKVTPLCYSSPYLWQQLTGNMLLDCIGWTAHWTSAAAPSWPVGWPVEKRKFWQWGTTKYAWVPPVPGVTGEVDVNRFYGTLADLRAFVGLTEPSDAEKLDRLWDAHPELH